MQSNPPSDPNHKSTLINFPALADHMPQFSQRPDERPTKRMLSPAAKERQNREEELIYVARGEFRAKMEARHGVRR